MSERHFVFTHILLTLYNLLYGEPLEKAAKLSETSAYVVSEFTPSMKEQYTLWLSLPNSMKIYIEKNAPIVLSVNLNKAEFKNLEEISQLTQEGRLANFKVLDDGYILYNGNDGKDYLVYAKYDSATNQLIPHPK